MKNINKHLVNKSTQKAFIQYDKGGNAEKILDELDEGMMEKTAFPVSPQDIEHLLTLYLGEEPRLTISSPKTGDKKLAWLSLNKTKGTYCVKLKEFIDNFLVLFGQPSRKHFADGTDDETGILKYFLDRLQANR